MKPVTESNLSVRAPGQRVAAMRDGCGLLEYRWRRAQRVILSRREPGVLRAARGLYGCVNFRQGKRASPTGYPVDSCECDPPGVIGAKRSGGLPRGRG